MRIVTEISLEDFEAWSGARDTLDTLNEKGLTEQLESILDDMGDGEMEEGWSDTSLNDFLWFETDTIAEWLGFSSWEALENDGEEEEEDEYTEEEQEQILNDCLDGGETFESFCCNFTHCYSCPFDSICRNREECEKHYNELMAEQEEQEEEE